MTEDEIISMAREAGFVTGTRDLMDGSSSFHFVMPIASSNCLPELERFAALIASKEREACAKACDPKPGIKFAPNYKDALQECAAAIRTRGMGNT